MFNFKKNPIRTPLFLLALLMLVPNQATAAQASKGAGDPPSTSLIILLSIISILTIAVLILLQKQRRGICPKTKKEKPDYIRILGALLPEIAPFQLTYKKNKTFHFTSLSESYGWILGLDPNKVIQDSTHLFNRVHKEDKYLLTEAFRQGKDKLTPADIKIRVLDSSDQLKWIHVRAVPRRENESLLWEGLMQDVSDSQHAESLLANETLNFKNIFNTLDDFFLIWDMNGKLLHANPTVENRLGYTLSDLKNMAIRDLFTEESRHEMDKITSNIQTNPSIVCAHPLQTKKGLTIPVKTNIFQGSWKNKNIIFGIAHDTTHQHKAEYELEVSQQMLQLIIDSIPMAIFWNDKNSIYQGGNKEFIHQYGLKNLKELIGKTPRDLFSPEDATGIIDRNQQVIESKKPLLNIHKLRPQPDGSSRWLEISKIPLHREEGQVDGVLEIWNNITDRKHAEERLKCTLEDMDRFNQLMRGRECRTLELKAEINGLLKNQGKPHKYKTTINSIP